MTLLSAKFEFSQDGNDLDELEYEHLEVRIESHSHIESSNDCFIVLKTDQWSMNSKEELTSLIDKINEAIDITANLPKSEQ